MVAARAYLKASRSSSGMYRSASTASRFSVRLTGMPAVRSSLTNPDSVSSRPAELPSRQRRQRLDLGHSTGDDAGGRGARSLAALSMSDWYLSRMWSVSVAVSASTDWMPSSSRVRAQSRVSDTDGAFFSSRFRMERTMRTTWSARASEMPGHPGQHDLLLPLEVGIVDVQEQAAPLERLGQLPGVVGGQEDQRDLGGDHRAELGDGHLIVGEDLQQQGLGLHLDPVHLVDQQHDRLVGPDGLQQGPGQQERLGEDVLLDVLPLARRWPLR